MPIDVMLSVAQGLAKGKSGHDFIYCVETACFYLYDSGYWKVLDELEIMSIILKYSNGDNNTVDISRFTFAKRGQILDNLKMLVYIKQEKFNKTGYLNFDLGEFDPITQTMHEHSKDHYSTLRMPYPFHHSAKCELWLKTINEIFEGDIDKINLLQEFFGYCLTRDVRHEKALLLIGESRTGKSTILETISAVMGGNNISAVPLSEIFNPQYSPLLMNKLVNIDTDVSSKADNYEAQFKKITSGESINCNPKYVAPFTFKPYCKLVMAANEFPIIKDHSSAFYKRLLVLPCDRIFEDHEQDIRLKDKLQNELTGIFNWAVEGLNRLSKRGEFIKKDFMSEALEGLRLESNPAELFLNDTIEADLENDNSIILKTELYERYRQWNIQTNERYCLSSQRFSQVVHRKYSKFTPKNSKDANGHRVWRNLRYKTNATLPQENIAWTD